MTTDKDKGIVGSASNGCKRAAQERGAFFARS